MSYHELLEELMERTSAHEFADDILVLSWKLGKNDADWWKLYELLLKAEDALNE